jgi:Ca2+-binding RTX toxin-like protein
MGIHKGDAASNTIDLTKDPAANYGLEDDHVAGFGNNDYIYTGAGNDVLDGGDGNDILYDGDGNDTVHGGAGNDKVQVDAGNDIYYGGEGIDTLWFDRIHYGADGFEGNFVGVRIDLALTSAQNLGEFGWDQFFGFEDVEGSYGHDMIAGTNAANDLQGIDGNDTLFGRGGNDYLNGGDGADILVGGLGQDQIFTTWSGIDAFRDVIRYESLKDSGTTGTTRDVVSWFKPGQDKIDLSKLDANLSLKGNQAFKVVKGFTKAPGEVKLVYSGGDTLVQIDGDKDSAVDMTILVLGVQLSKGDFIL